MIKQIFVLQGCLKARCRRWIRIHERNDWTVPECPAWAYVLLTWDINLNHALKITEYRWYFISRIFLTVDQQEPMTVQFISYPFHGSVSLRAGPAQFGYNLKVKPPVCYNKSCYLHYSQGFTIYFSPVVEELIGNPWLGKMYIHVFNVFILSSTIYFIVILIKMNVDIVVEL